jgi:Protein of unknown function (DUF559)
MTVQPRGARLLSALESEERFRPLAHFFLERTVEELFPKTESDIGDGSEPLAPLVNVALELLLDKCHASIGVFSESPIEQVFMRSLTLSFLKNFQCPVFMPAFRDTMTELPQWHDQLAKLSQFIKWHQLRHGSGTVSDEFFENEVESGRMPENEVSSIKELLLFYHHLPLRDAWHLSLQARFPALLHPKGTARVDMLFWLPATPSLRIIVECDGFSAHRFKTTFERDRRRDRALKAKGFEVLRFSGAEINADPAGSATELFSFLLERKTSHLARQC